MTWDGIVTTYHKKYCREIGFDKFIQAYIQSSCLKRTFEAISFEYRRSGRVSREERDELLENRFEQLHLIDEGVDINVEKE